MERTKEYSLFDIHKDIGDCYFSVTIKVLKGEWAKKASRKAEGIIRNVLQAYALKSKEVWVIRVTTGIDNSYSDNGLCSRFIFLPSIGRILEYPSVWYSDEWRSYEQCIKDIEGLDVKSLNHLNFEVKPLFDLLEETLEKELSPVAEEQRLGYKEHREKKLQEKLQP